MRKIRAIADRCIGWLLAALMGLAALNVLWQVFTRYVMSDPSDYTEQSARYLLVWISVIGAGYAVGSRSHLAIDLLPEKLARTRCGLPVELAIDACITSFAVLVMILGGLALVRTTLSNGETSPELGLRVGYVYLAIPLAGLIMTFYAVLNAADRMTGRRDGSHREARPAE